MPIKVKKRFVLRKREGGFVVFDLKTNQAISYPIADRKEAQAFCNKFVGVFFPEYGNKYFSTLTDARQAARNLVRK